VLQESSSSNLSEMPACSRTGGIRGAARWFRRLNANVRNRLIYDFLIYSGAGMWARYDVSRWHTKRLAHALDVHAVFFSLHLHLHAACCMYSESTIRALECARLPAYFCGCLSMNAQHNAVSISAATDG